MGLLYLVPKHILYFLPPGYITWKNRTQIKLYHLAIANIEYFKEEGISNNYNPGMVGVLMKELIKKAIKWERPR